MVEAPSFFPFFFEFSQENANKCIYICHYIYLYTYTRIHTYIYIYVYTHFAGGDRTLFTLSHVYTYISCVHMYTSRYDIQHTQPYDLGIIIIVVASRLKSMGEGKKKTRKKKMKNPASLITHEERNACFAVSIREVYERGEGYGFEYAGKDWRFNPVTGEGWGNSRTERERERRIFFGSGFASVFLQIKKEKGKERKNKRETRHTIANLTGKRKVCIGGIYKNSSEREEINDDRSGRWEVRLRTRETFWTTRWRGSFRRASSTFLFFFLAPPSFRDSLQPQTPLPNGKGAWRSDSFPRSICRYTN